MKLRLQRRPQRVEPVVVDPGRMQQHFEAVAVHAPALVARRDARQLMGRLEHVTPPDVRRAGPVQLNAGVRRAAYASGLQARQIDVLP
jgi:hypothetical protein